MDPKKPIFTLREAAMAVRMPLKTLRNWISRDEIIPHGHRDDEGFWRLMSLLEVVQLYIARRLSEYGVSIKEAWLLAGDVNSKWLYLKSQKETETHDIARVTNRDAIKTEDPSWLGPIVADTNYRLNFYSNEYDMSDVAKGVHIFINVKGVWENLGELIEEQTESQAQAK